MRVGTDIVEIARIPSDNLAFINGVLSLNERKILSKRIDKAEFIAGRFAAKEAFLKALGTGLSGTPLNLIDVSYREDGSPLLTYKEKQYEVSIAHDGGYATSVVIIP